MMGSTGTTLPRGLLVLIPLVLRMPQHKHGVRVPLPCRLLQQRYALLRPGLALHIILFFSVANPPGIDVWGQIGSPANISVW
jgi:hypothetical protein